MNGAGRPENNDPHQPRPEEDQWEQAPAPPPAWGNPAATDITRQDPQAPPVEQPAQENAEAAAEPGPMPGLPEAPPWQYGPPNDFGSSWGPQPVLPPDAFASPGAQPPGPPAVPPPNAISAAPPPEAFAPSVPPPSYTNPAPPPGAFGAPAPPPPPPPPMGPGPSPGAFNAPPAGPERFHQPVASEHFGGPPAMPLGPGAQGNEPWVIQGGTRRRRRFPTVPVLIVVGALVVAGGGGYGIYSVLGKGGSDPDKTPVSQVADDLFAVDTTGPDGRDQAIANIAAAGNTVVAAGSEVGGAAPRPAFLFSTDQGRTWKVAPVKSEDGSAATGRPDVITGAPGAWLALGASGNDRAVWTSKDGRSWTQLSGRVNAFRADDEIEGITRTPQAFVAVGHRASDRNAAPIVWRSADGRAWERLDGGRLKLPAKAGKPAGLRYVAAAGGALLVTGDVVKAKSTVAAVWRSTDDARTWTAMDSPSGNGAFGSVHLAATSGGFLALREGKDGQDRFGVVFRSADGENWQAGGTIRSADGAPINPQRIVGGDQGFAVLSAGPGDQRTLYQSTDGANWRPSATLTDDPVRTAAGLAVTSGGVVIGGTRRGPDQDFYLAMAGGPGSPAQIDVAKVPGAVNRERSVRDVATASGRTVAVGSANGRAAAWTSGDGVTWSRADTSSLGGSEEQGFTKVAHGPQGWLAIGSKVGRPFAATSPDGRSWQAVDERTFAGTANRPPTLSAVANGAKGYVIVGTDGGDSPTSFAVAWHSADLRTWRRGQIPASKSGAPRTILDVAAGSAGYAAVGETTDADRPPAQRARPGIWTSPDGLRWTEKQAALPNRASAGRLSQVTISGNTVVAAGEALFSGTRAFVMVSDDLGTTWRAAQLPMPVQGTPSYVTARTVSPKAFVILGTVGGALTGDVIMWSSPDGRSWRMSSPKGVGLAGAGLQRVHGITPQGAGYLGVGITTENGPEKTTLWRPPAQ
ncbi:hypothetical protein [Actinomadura sp. HBU206391]|uniref:hypothetical protein n=1 Tax=Actinomadura sp. HBU206391 TaxID=2731692 RepID=UPI00164F478F|nr:hypothetical protein [Actinomadura sp. HBU206391]MBC6458775.1 hypothetical protein [Actinomadura sp. HBU206391]